MGKDEKMRKTTYLVIGGVAAVLVIGVGAFGVRSNRVKGNGYGNSTQSEQNTKESKNTTELKNTTQAQNTADSKTKAGATDAAKIEAFHSIEANVETINLEIKEGNQYSIENNQNIEISYSNQNNVLKFEQRGKTNVDDDYATVTITVPKEKTLESIDITNGSGDIELHQITAKNLTYVGADGDLEIAASNIETVDAKSETGDIEFDNMEFSQMKVETKSEDAELKAAVDLSNYAVVLRSESGEVEVNGKNHGKEYKNDVQSEKTLDITTSTGDIEVTY